MTDLATALSDASTAIENYNQKIVSFALQHFIKIVATGTFTVPKNVTRILVNGVAAGGSGGGVPARTTGNTSGGAGGGGAGQPAIDVVLTVIPEEVLTITIGAPGAASAAAGNSGANLVITGSSSGALLQLTGGAGGAAGIVSSTVPSGATGGVG